MNVPSFSVVIPTFRRPEKLKRALDSVVSQKYTNFEIVVVDDDEESRDDVYQIVNRFGCSHIRYLRNKRTKGANGARNTGILNSKNEYVALLDDDDEWTDDHLFQIEQYFVSNGAKMHMTLSAHTLIEGNCTRIIVPDRNYLTLNRYLRKHITVNTGSTFCAKKSLIVQNCLFDEEMKRNQDIDFLIRVLQKECVKLLEKPTAVVYGHNNCTLSVLMNSKFHLFGKIENSDIDKTLKRIFISRGYRELATAALREKKLKLAAQFIACANRQSLLGPISYVKYAVILADRFLNLNIENKLRKNLKTKEL